MVLVIGLIYYSIGYTGYIATLDWDGVSPYQESVGGANFTRMLRDPFFWKSIQNTIIFYVVTFVIQNGLGFTLAAILHTRVKLAAVHKVIIFIPTVLAPATMAPTFRLFFDVDGMANRILRTIGLDGLTQTWLAKPTTAMIALMMVTIWQWTGMSFILYYAAMSQIEPELLEAARLDGAGNLRTLSAIVWPGCRGTTMAMAILGLIGALKTFDWPWLITVAGPNHATEFLGTYIYRMGIRQSHIGYASAMALALLALAIGGALLMTLTNRKAAKSNV